MTVYHGHKIHRHLSGFRHPCFSRFTLTYFKLRFSVFFVRIIVSLAVYSYDYTLGTIKYFSHFSLRVTLFSRFNHLTIFNEHTLIERCMLYGAE